MNVCAYCVKQSTCIEECTRKVKEDDMRADMEMDMQSEYDEEENCR